MITNEDEVVARTLTYQGPTLHATKVYSAIEKYCRQRRIERVKHRENGPYSPVLAVYDLEEFGELEISRSRKGFPQGKPKRGHSSVQAKIVMNALDDRRKKRGSSALEYRTVSLMEAVKSETHQLLEMGK